MPPNGSEAYRQASTSIRDWRLDPRLAEEYAARQERMDAARLAQLAEEGQIAAEGTTRMGEVLSEGVRNAQSSYYKGKDDRRAQDAHNQRMQLSEEELANKKAEREWLDSSGDPAAEEGKPLTHRQQTFKLKGAKTQAEIDALNNKTPKSQTLPTSMTSHGKPVYFDPTTNSYVAGNIEIDKKPTAGSESKPILVTYTNDAGEQVQEFVTPEAGKKFTAKKPPAAPKSPGQDAEDRKFAADLNEWEGTGKGNFEANISRLEGAKKKLAQRVLMKKDTRGVIGIGQRSESRLPDEMKSVEDVTIRDDVRQAAQGALKATLGAQFTEREGNMIMARSYNEDLPPEENLKKIQIAIDELESKKRHMDHRGKHFRSSGGTLAGYQPLDAPMTVQEDPPPGPGAGSATAAPKAPPPPDGTKKVINGKPMVRVPGGWTPDATP